MSHRAAVIGGGIFGLNIAIELSKIRGLKVQLYDKNSSLMEVASKNNHNRIHLGYHYLRSESTARQSLSGLLSFMFNYGNSVVYQFPNYYGIAREGSLTNPQGFIKFCELLQIDYEEVWPDPYLMNPELLQASFKVPEPIFDFETLRSSVLARLQKTDTEVFLNHHCDSVRKLPDGFELNINGKKVHADFVINAAYENFNLFNIQLGINTNKLLYQDVFIPIFEYDADRFGLTVMDGPFCSVMPKGFDSKTFLLYHVVHSVIEQEECLHREIRGNLSDELKRKIVSDSMEFYPFLKDVKVIDYWRSIRVLNKNNDDARITELSVFDEIENYYGVLSGKITTCCKVARDVQLMIKEKLS